MLLSESWNNIITISRREAFKRLVLTTVFVWWSITSIFKEDMQEIAPKQAKPVPIPKIQKISPVAPFEKIHQTNYCSPQELIAYIIDCGLIQRVKRSDYLQSLKQDDNLSLKDETWQLLESLHDKQYSPKDNQVVRQIIYETLLNDNKNTIEASTNNTSVHEIAIVITDLLHRQLDPHNDQVKSYMQIQGVDPWVRQSLNPETISSIHDNIQAQEVARISVQQKQRTRKEQEQKKNMKTIISHEAIYYFRGIRKYSFTKAYDLLHQANIKLRSSKLEYKETWESRWNGHTSLVNINADTIDYIISCKQKIDDTYWNTGIWYITGATELWDHISHHDNSISHPNWYKIDIRGRWIPALMLAIEYGSTSVNEANNHTHKWISASFRYHQWSGYHMDIRITKHK